MRTQNLVFTLLIFSLIAISITSCDKEEFQQTSQEEVIKLRSSSGVYLPLSPKEQQVVDIVRPNFEQSRESQDFNTIAQEFNLGILNWDLAWLLERTDQNVLLVPFDKPNINIHYALHLTLKKETNEILQVSPVAKNISGLAKFKIATDLDSSIVESWKHLFNYIEFKRNGGDRTNARAFVLSSINQKVSLQITQTDIDNFPGEEAWAIGDCVHEVSVWPVYAEVLVEVGYGCPGDPEFTPDCYEVQHVGYDISIESTDCFDTDLPPGGSGGNGGPSGEDYYQTFRRTIIAYIQEALPHQIFSPIHKIWLKFFSEKETKCKESLLAIHDFLESHEQADGTSPQAVIAVVDCFIEGFNIFLVQDIDCEAIQTSLENNTLNFMLDEGYVPLYSNDIQSLPTYETSLDETCFLLNEFDGPFPEEISDVMDIYSIGIASETLPVDALSRIHNALQQAYPNGTYSVTVFKLILTYPHYLPRLEEYISNGDLDGFFLAVDLLLFEEEYSNEIDMSESDRDYVLAEVSGYSGSDPIWQFIIYYLKKIYEERNSPYNQANDCEKELIQQHPYCGASIGMNWISANTFTRRKMGTNGANECSDAFRHAIFNALNTIYCGPDLAEEFGIARECTSSSQTAANMDLHNNGVGRSIIQNNPQIGQMIISGNEAQGWVQLLNELCTSLSSGNMQVFNDPTSSDPDNDPSVYLVNSSNCTCLN